MKTIIAGSRDINLTLDGLDDIIKSMDIDVSLVVSGTARGIDTLGESWAKSKSISVLRCPADWNRYGKRAGYLRNETMADISDALIAIWDGSSRGTKHMIDIAKKKNLKVFVHIVLPKK